MKPFGILNCATESAGVQRAFGVEPATKNNLSPSMNPGFRDPELVFQGFDSADDRDVGPKALDSLEDRGVSFGKNHRWWDDGVAG